MSKRLSIEAAYAIHGGRVCLDSDPDTPLSVEEISDLIRRLQDKLADVDADRDCAWIENAQLEEQISELWDRAEPKDWHAELDQLLGACVGQSLLSHERVDRVRKLVESKGART